MPGGFVATWGGLATVWDGGFASAEQRPVQPDIEVPMDSELLGREGPVVAAVERRRRAVETALRLVGIEPQEFLEPLPYARHPSESLVGSGDSNP